MSKKQKKHLTEDQIEEYNFYRFGYPSASVRQEIDGLNYDPDDDETKEEVIEFGHHITNDKEEIEQICEAQKENIKAGKIISQMNCKKTKIYAPKTYIRKLTRYNHYIKKDPKIKIYEYDKGRITK